MVALFWGSILAIAYTYFGYPAILYILSRIRGRRMAPLDSTFCPSVTLIITAHNEEKRIQKKIENTLAIDYPRDRLEVLVASDASTDRTDDIVRDHADNGITLVRAPERRGKEFAQKCAIEKARGEVIVFSDVATMIEKDGISRIVSNFSDLTVGCVSSEDRVLDEQGNVSGEGAYVRYEMWLRSLETQVNSVVGLSGSFFAARAEVCREWPTTIPSDFNTLLNSIKLGLRGISDPHSIGIYTNIKDEKKEFDRKVRTITRGIAALMANIGLMNPFRFGIFSWQLASHKLMRWLVPWLLISSVFSNIILVYRSALFKTFCILQVLFYGSAFLHNKLSVQGISIIKIPHYFVQVNMAIARAWVEYLKGERYVTWNPSTR